MRELKIGIYGGTFDPPHIGHIAAAQAAMETLALDRLLLIPTFIPPHKALPAGAASPAQRRDMAVLATAELGKKAEVLDVELRREGPSYSWETLCMMKNQFPEDELWLLMGSDMFLTLQDWREPQRVMSMAHIGAFSRRKDGEEAVFARQKAFLERKFGADVTVIPNPQGVELSSTEVRQALAQGGGADLLPPAVYGYVLRERLYSTKKALTGLTPDELRPIALSYLKPKRMPHVLGTEQEAVRLARRYGGDEIQARIAALLHDCTKKLDMDRQLSLCRHYGIDLDPLEQVSLKLLHSKTGAAVARDKFGVSEEIYNAIYYHTTGKADMTLLEKIIYLADYIEPSRCFPGVDELRRAVHTDLNEGLYRALLDSVKELQGYGSPVHPHTREALDSIRSEIGGTIHE